MRPHDPREIEREQREADLLWSASRVDRAADHHLTESGYVCSPAVGKHAVTVLVPKLQRELDEAHATIDELRSRIEHMKMPAGVGGW